MSMMATWTYGNDEDAQHVKHDQAVEDTLDGAGNSLAGVLGFTKSGGNDFSAQEPGGQ